MIPTIRDWEETTAPKDGEIRATLRAPLMFEVRQVPAGEEGDHEFIITTAGMKRDHAIVELKGLKTEQYLKNPVVMFAHDYGSFPIGRTVKLVKKPEFIKATVKYAPTQRAQEVKMLVSEGFLKGASIAWWPTKTEEIRDEKDQFVGIRYVESDLIEWSVVPVPLDPGALAVAGAERSGLGQALTEARSRGLLKISEVEQDFTQLRDLDQFRGILSLDTLKRILTSVDLPSRPGIDETENEYRYRLRDPGDFDQDSFRRILLKRRKPRVFGIAGHLHGEQKMTMQALRFPKDDGWDKSSVQEWVDAHKDDFRDLTDSLLRELIEVVEESPDAPIPALETPLEERKSVSISAKNKERLVQCQGHLQTVMSTLTEMVGEEATQEGVTDPPSVTAPTVIPVSDVPERTVLRISESQPEGVKLPVELETLKRTIIEAVSEKTKNLFGV